MYSVMCHIPFGSRCLRDCHGVHGKLSAKALLGVSGSVPWW